jgi:hypothetical protein
MLPVNNVPGHNNLHMYQPVSIQGQPTILGQAIPPTQISLHIQNQQFLSSNLQPLIDNHIPSPSRYNKQCRVITTDDEQDEDITANTNMPNWQIVSGTKRRKTNKVLQDNNSTESPVTTNNRYDLLTNAAANEEEIIDVNTRKKIPRPPPIFVYDVINYPQMINHLDQVTEEENYNTRSVANNKIKISCNAPETYRKMIKFMKEKSSYIIHMN